MSHVEGIVDVVFQEGPLYIKVNRGSADISVEMQYVPTVVKFLSTADHVTPSPIR